MNKDKRHQEIFKLVETVFSLQLNSQKTKLSEQENNLIGAVSHCLYLAGYCKMNIPIALSWSEIVIGKEVMIESLFSKGFFTTGIVDNIENEIVTIKPNEEHPLFWIAKRPITEIFYKDGRIIKSYKGEKSRWE